MRTEDETTAVEGQRVVELRRAIAAGEYAPAAELVAGEVLATLGLIRRARRRIEALGAARFEPEARPPTRRFRPRPEPGRSPAAEHESASAA